MRNLIILIFLVFSIVGKAQTDSIVNVQEIGSGDIDLDIEEDVPVFQNKSPEPFLAVQEMPKFSGGEDSMWKFIYRNLVYPQAAKENEVEGKVWVKFTVTSTGEIINPRVISKEKLGYGCEESAMAVIIKMPKWKPGKQNGVPVDVYFNLSVKFKL
ncbi:MAG: energy transducer TonB [Bacteroidia bacterium]